MNRLYALLTVLIVCLSASAQKRLVLVEEFTNTGCGPCATWSPVLDAAIDYRLGDCIAIKYHVGFPDPADIFHAYDATAQDARRAFYGVNGVPATYIDGNELNERSYSMMNTAIDYCQQQAAKASLTISKTVAGHVLTTDVEVTPLADLDATNLRLFVATIEEHIVADQPYSNGETELNYTMRKMLTDGNGATLTDGPTLTAGQTAKHHASWTIDFFDDERQLGVVAFVQDIITHEILCTAYSGPVAEGENQLALMSLSGTPDLICVPDYHGEVIFRNNGANTLTSATLNVQVNGTVKQYPWTGSLGYLDRASLAFDSFTTFTLAEENEVSLWFSDINGSEAVSNTLTSTFANSIQASHAVRLRLYTDKKPEEISWKLYNSAGDVVREGGPYTEARKFMTEDFNLTTDDCYLLEFLDAGGDGIKGANGNGYYQLFQVDEEGKTQRIAQGDYSGAVHDVYFRLTSTPQPERRLVLFEEFTNTSCDPCAEFSPALDRTINERMDEMVAITYHYNFPSPQDPFYLNNTTDNMARANFYGVTGVPALRVDGEHAGAWGYEDYLDSYIDAAATVPAQVDINTEATLTDGLLTARVSLLPKGVTDGSNLRLLVAAVEERVEWTTPAANGERSWNYVMRKLLPSAEGEPLPADLSQVTPYQYQFSWQVEGYTDERELGLVTFVQDISTGKVLGAVYTPRPTGSTQAAKILSVSDTPDRICAPLFGATLRVRNTGRETLTSAIINVSVNGQVQRTPWTGSLPYLSITTMQTPTFTDFTLSDGGQNEVDIWLSDLNGGTEESAHKAITISNAHKAQNAVRLTLMTDNAPEEITWQVSNAAGDVVCEGGPYTEARKKQVIVLPLTVDDCYTLEFRDSGNDGITGENGRGYYMLHEVAADGKARLLVQADYTTASHTVYFGLENANATGIATVTASAQPAQEPVFDTMGRPATDRTRLVISKDGKRMKK